MIDSVDIGSTLIIPLSWKGIVSYLPVHKPAIAEWKNKEKYPCIELTAEELCWDLENSSNAEQEEGMVEFRRQIIINPTTLARKKMMISSMSASLPAIAADVAADENFDTTLESKVLLVLQRFFLLIRV